MSGLDDLTLREMREEDRSHIVASWLNSCSKSPEFSSLRRSVFYRLYAPQVEAMLARSVVAIATKKDMVDTDAILGWMAIEGDLLHFVRTKSRPSWRRLGVARFLLADLLPMPVRYTHQPPSWATALLPATWTYDPDARFPKVAA